LDGELLQEVTVTFFQSGHCSCIWRSVDVDRHIGTGRGSGACPLKTHERKTLWGSIVSLWVPLSMTGLESRRFFSVGRVSALPVSTEHL
jgi:hypothetical protein